MKINELLESKISDKQKETIIKNIYYDYGINSCSSQESTELFKSLYRESTENNGRFTAESTVLPLREKWELLTQYMLNSANHHRSFYRNIKFTIEEVLSETDTYVRDKSGNISGKIIHGSYTVGVGIAQGLHCGHSIMSGMLKYLPGIGEVLLVPVGIPALAISTLAGFCVGVNRFATRHFISTNEQKQLFAKIREINSPEEKQRIIARVVAEYHDTYRSISNSSFNLMKILTSRWVSTETKFKHLVTYMTENVGVITENNGKRLFVTIKNAILQPESSMEIKASQFTSSSICNSIFISNSLYSREEKLFFQQLNNINSPALQSRIIERVKSKYKASYFTSSASSAKLILTLQNENLSVREKFNSLKIYMEKLSNNNGKKLFAIIKHEIMITADQGHSRVQRNTIC